MSKWNQTNYFAWILLKIRTINFRSKFDIFYDKKLSDMKINNRIWELLKLIEFKMSSTRIIKKLVKHQFTNIFSIAFYFVKTTLKQSFVSSLQQLMFFRVVTFVNSNVIKTKFENDQEKFQFQFVKIEFNVQFKNEILKFKNFDDIIFDIMKNEFNEIFDSSKTMSNV